MKTYEVKSQFFVRNAAGQWVAHEQNVSIKTADSSHIKIKNVQTKDQRNQD